MNYDGIIEVVLRRYVPEESVLKPVVKMPADKKKQSSKNPLTFNVSQIVLKYFQTNLFVISGIGNSTVLSLLTTLGKDINKFATAKSFASWLQLVPNNKISGGRILSNSTPAGKSYIATALRQAANSICNQANHERNPFFK